MPSPYKPIGNHPRHPENPFVEKAIKDIKIVKRTKVARASNKAMQVIVNNDGEVTGHSQFLQYIEVDEERFTKLYLSQFASFWELSKPAIRVFGYIMTVMKPGQDKFIFRMDEAQKYTHYKQEVSIFNGLSQLIDCNIIARTKYDWEYYINPLVMFNGDRVTFAKTYVKKKKQSDPNQIPIFGDNEDQAEIIMEGLPSNNELKRLDSGLPPEKETGSWSNFTGDLNIANMNVSEERIKEMIKLVVEKLREEQSGS